MKCFVQNIPMMRTAAIKTQTTFLTRETIEELWDESFILNVEEEINNLNPICDYIDYAQSQDCSLADSVAKWIQIKPLLGHYKKWEKRDEMICDISSLISYCLHPKYKGKDLTNHQNLKVKTWIHKHGEKVYSQYEKFLKNEGKFGAEYLQGFNPEYFWKLLTHEYPELGGIANLYVHLPASTASLERVFSMWAFVHNKNRNRLSKITSEKLIFLYFTLKTFDTKKIIKIFS